MALPISNPPQTSYCLLVLFPVSNGFHSRLVSVVFVLPGLQLVDLVEARPRFYPRIAWFDSGVHSCLASLDRDMGPRICVGFGASRENSPIFMILLRDDV